MACNISRFIAIKPVICQSYACYETGTESGHVFCNEKSVFNPFTKIELEKATKYTNYYSLRFYQSNRYWAKCEGDNRIVAVSKQPDEDTTKSSCTLFKPIINDKGVLRLIHVQSGNTVLTDSATTRLSLDKDIDDNDIFAFTFVDWDALVKLPRRVVFKADNNKFLKAVVHGDLSCLEFTSTDPNDGYSSHEVSLHRHGHLQIKSEFHEKFWRRSSSNWILADSSDEGGNDRDTLFWPVKVDDKTITLRNAGNEKTCGRLTSTGKTDCLIAPGDGPKFEVEVLVLESLVHNVSFRTEDDRVLDEQSYVADTQTAVNESDKELPMTLYFTYDVTNSFSFTHSYPLKIDAKTTFNAAVPPNPKIAENIQAVDYVGILAWGQIVSETKTIEVSYPVTVPAKSQIKVNRNGIHGKWGVPFSYTQRDTYSGDGEYDSIDHNDGVFYGANDYGFTFEKFPAKPICP